MPNAENHFSLIDEQWIPIADIGLVSLKEIFLHKEYNQLGGNPIEKISLLKLLFAIVQSAYTPDTEKEWAMLGVEGMAARCLAYLEEQHEHFYLYGSKPFLQFPQLKNTPNPSEYGIFLPHITTGNTTVFFESNISTTLSDAEKALFLITHLNFSFSGKKTDNSIVLSKGHSKTKSSYSAPSLGYLGLLHSFYIYPTLLETLYVNIYTQEKIQERNIFEQGIGNAPWEEMPLGEDCKKAHELQKSYIGRLVPLSRFSFLDEKILFCTEGIIYPNYKESIADLSVGIKHVKNELKPLWVNTTKRPWRELSSLLSFIDITDPTRFECPTLYDFYPRILRKNADFYIWSGGIRVSSNAGEQYTSGTDDFVESSILLKAETLKNAEWFTSYKIEMKLLEDLAEEVKAHVSKYFKDLKGKEQKAEQASEYFWKLCEQAHADLIQACMAKSKGDLEELEKIRKEFCKITENTYSFFCPKSTARQLTAWAHNLPHPFAKYKNK